MQYLFVDVTLKTMSWWYVPYNVKEMLLSYGENCKGGVEEVLFPEFG